MVTPKSKAFSLALIQLLSLSLATHAHAIEVESTGTKSLDNVIRAYDKFGDPKALVRGSKNLIRNGSAQLISEEELTRVRNAVQGGDSVVVQYELSEAESRNARASALRQEITSLRARAATQQRLSDEAQNPSEERLAKARKAQGIRTLKTIDLKADDLIDLVAAAHYGDEAERLNQLADIAETQLDDILAGRKNPVVVRIGQIDTLGGNVTDVDSFLRERVLTGSKISRIDVIPRSTVVRGKVMVRAGWMGVAAAAVAGIVGGLQLVPDENKTEADNTRVFKPAIVDLEGIRRF